MMHEAREHLIADQPAIRLVGVVDDSVESEADAKVLAA